MKNFHKTIHPILLSILWFDDETLTGESPYNCLLLFIKKNIVKHRYLTIETKN